MLEIGTIEKWRMTGVQCSRAVRAAYAGCPEKHWKELEEGDIVIDERRNTCIVIKTYPVRKPLLNGVTPKGEPTGQRASLSQKYYKVATPELLQYAGKTHEDSVIDAALEGLPVPEEVLSEVAAKVSEGLASSKHCVVSWFISTLTFGRNTAIKESDILPDGWRTNAENYQSLMQNPRLEELKTGFEDWEASTAKRVMERVERHEKFLAVAGRAT